MGPPRFDFLQLFSCSVDLCHDLLDVGSPNKGPGLGVPALQECLNALFQVGHADKGPSSHRFVGQLCEPPLNLIEPTGTGWNEMQFKAAVSLEPGLHFGVLVRAVVVQHQVKIQLFCELPIQASEKLQKLLMPMMGKTLTDHFTFQDFQGREQRGRTVAFVVVGHGSTPSFFQWQSGLSTVQGLNLAFFIHAYH